MTREVYEWIIITSSVSPLIPLVCFIIYRKRQPIQNLILTISLIISFAFDMTSLSLARWFDPKLICVSNNLYFMIAFPAIMWFYHETLIKRPLKIVIRIFTVIFLAAALIFAIQQGLNVPNYNTMTLSSILITVASFFFVADLNLMDESQFMNNPFHETNIILNTSLALYYFTTIIMFAISDYVFSQTTVEGARFFWACHNTLNVLKNVGVTVAFYLTAKRIHALPKLESSKARHHAA